MNTDLIILAYLCTPAFVLIMIFVLLETYDKLMELIVLTIAGILAVCERIRKRTDRAMQEVQE